jgi:hypothetical protein
MWVVLTILNCLSDLVADKLGLARGITKIIKVSTKSKKQIF